jgi:hypothetical protein
MQLNLQKQRFVPCADRVRLINHQLAVAAQTPAGETFFSSNTIFRTAGIFIATHQAKTSLKRSGICRGKISQRKIKINLEERTPPAPLS